MSLRSPLAFGLLLALAPATLAQPVAGARIVAAWSDAQRAARAEAGPVRFVERAVRDVEGPNMARDIRTETAVVLGTDGPRRRLVAVEVDGQPVRPARFALLERRMAQALGPASVWVREAPLPGLLADFRPDGEARAVEIDGRPVWEVPGDASGPRGDVQATLWFTRGQGPIRLARARFERRLPQDGSALLDVTFTAVGTLDLPARHHAEGVVRQRRRLRLFTILVRADATYGDYRVGGR